MAESAVTITLSTIADGAGQVSDRVDNSAAKKRVVRFNLRIKSGTAPAADVLYHFFLHRQDDETISHSDDTVGEADAALTTIPVLSEPMGTIVLTNDSDTPFETSFVVYDPGPYWSVSFWNASGQAIHATEDDHYIRYSYLD